MVVISNSTLRQNVYETIYDVLNSNVGSYNSSSQPTVTASYYDDPKSLPQIVVYPVDVDTLGYTFGQNNPHRELRVMLEVYSKKKKDLDILSDDIDVLMDVDIAGICLIGRAESMAFSQPNNNKLHLKTITFTFKRR